MRLEVTQNFLVSGKYTIIHPTYQMRKTSDFFVWGKYYEESFLVVDSVSSNAVTIPERMNLECGGGGESKIEWRLEN